MEVNKEKYSFEELEAEQKQIEDCFLTLRFGQQVRKEVMACFKKCGGQIKYPFRIEADALKGKEEICFGDCVNLAFERGPFLNQLGNVPEDSIPKKFIWAHETQTRYPIAKVYKLCSYVLIGINSILVNADTAYMHDLGRNSDEQQGSMIFTASRDRYIKIWHCDYLSKQLRANLDEHTDWVNQIILAKENNVLISCSNDTTIKLWQLDSLYSQQQQHDKYEVTRLRSFHTLNEDYDYVRTIDYSSQSHKLFSAADNGIVRMWDLNIGALVQEISLPLEQRNQSKIFQMRYSEVYKSDQIIPTSISSSHGGNILAVAFTDEQIRIFDMRMKTSQQAIFSEMVLKGEHSEMIRQIKLSPDGMVCLSAGSDCSLKVWDTATRKCIKSIGPEACALQKKYSTYHKDSISAMEVDFDAGIVFTGGRDGSIFKTDFVENQQYNKVFQGDSKHMITCMKLDPKAKKLWYGTTDSSFKCLDVNKDDQVCTEMKGLPWITDYHVLKNKRYILTANQSSTHTSDSSHQPERKVYLWSMDSGEVVKVWKSKTFQQVQKILNDEYDLNQNGEGSRVEIPNQWFTVDIKLGSLSIHLDEDSWHKGVVSDNETNIVKMLVQHQSPNKLDIKQQKDSSLNLGVSILDKAFHAVQKFARQQDETYLQQYLHANYEDYAKLRSMRQSKAKQEEKKSNDIQDVAAYQLYFMFLEEMETQKPLWSGMADDPPNHDIFLHYLPNSMQKLIKRSAQSLTPSDKQQTLYFTLQSENTMQLPRYQQNKKLQCPGTTKVSDVILHLNKSLTLERYIITSEKPFNPLTHVELVLPVKVNPSSQSQSNEMQALVGGSEDCDYYIVCDQAIELVYIQRFILPLTGCSEPSGVINFRYRLKQRNHEPLESTDNKQEPSTNEERALLDTHRPSLV